MRDEGAVPIRTCEDRQQVSLTGTISTVTIHPRGGHPALEVELRDGSGAVTLVWLGRRQIPGIDPGRTSRSGVGSAVTTGAGWSTTPATSCCRLRPLHERSGRTHRVDHPARSRTAPVPLRRGARPLPAREDPRRRTRHGRVGGALHRLHRGLGGHPPALSLPGGRPRFGRRPGRDPAGPASVGAVRRQAIIPTAIAALVASRTGRAEDIFLPGILYNGGLAVLSLLTIAIRKPLVGFIIGAATGDPTGWMGDRGLVRMTSKLTAVLAVPYTAAVRRPAAAVPGRQRHLASASPRSSSAGPC